MGACGKSSTGKRGQSLSSVQLPQNKVGSDFGRALDLVRDLQHSDIVKTARRYPRDKAINCVRRKGADTMRSSNIASIVRGVPLALAKRRLAEIARIARQSRGVDSLCRHWPLSRFEFVEHAALALLESPPFNLSALAMDEL